MSEKGPIQDPALAEHMAYAGKAEHDRNSENNGVISRLNTFSESAKQTINELEEKQSEGLRGVEKNTAEFRELMESNSAEKDLLADEIGDRALDMLRDDPEMQRLLLQEKDNLGISITGNKLNALNDPDAHKQMLIEAGNSEDVAQEMLDETIDNLKKQLSEAFGSAFVPAQETRDFRSRIEEVASGLESTADTKEAWAKVIFENPEVQEEVKKYVSELTGKTFEEATGGKTEVDAAIMMKLRQNRMQVFSTAEKWGRVKKSDEISDAIQDLKETEPSKVISKLGWMSEELEQSFGGRDSEVFTGFLELQESDETTMKDIKDYYDKHIQQKRDIANTELERYDNAIGRYVKLYEETKTA